MGNGKVAATGLAASVLTMWGAPSAEGAFVDSQVQVSVSGSYSPQSQVDDALLLIWSYSYDGFDTRYDLEFRSLGTLTGQGAFSYSDVFDIGIPINYDWPNAVAVAILGTHESDSGDGVTVGMDTNHANYVLGQSAWNRTFSRVLFGGSNDPSVAQQTIHDAIEAGDTENLAQVFFLNEELAPWSRLPGDGAEVRFAAEDLNDGTIERRNLSLTLLNFSEATYNGTARVNISIAPVPEPAALSLGLAALPLLARRRRRI